MSGSKSPLARTAQELVADRLRSELLSGVYPQGARLAQSEIAARLNVSITPVREALRDLVMEGLVDIDRYRGAVVHAPSQRELFDVFAIRKQLVPLSTGLGVVRITPAEIETCAAILARMEASHDDEEWSLLNREFHRTIDAISGNQHLVDILHRLGDVAMLYIRLTIGGETERRTDAESEHRALLNAYVTGDAEEATSIYLAHFDGTLRAAEAHLFDA